MSASNRTRIIDFLKIFNLLRLTSTKYYMLFVDRVNQELGSPALTKKEQENQNVVKQQNSLSAIISVLRKRRKEYRRQYAAIKSLKNYTPFVLLISGKRNLRYWNKDLSFIDYISFMNTGFESSEDKNLLVNKINTSDSVFVFDTDLESLVRDSSIKERKDIFALDQGFFLYVILTKKPGLVLMLAIQYLLAKLKKDENQLLYPGKLYYCFFDLMFRNAKDATGVLNTSNTFSVEALRSYMISSTNFEIVYEVMHGIPSNLTQNFFSGWVEYSHRFKSKFQLITQIPTIQDKIITDHPDSIAKTLAINSYYNSYVSKSKVDSQEDVVAYVDQKFQDCFGTLTKSVDNSFVLFYIGAGTVSNKESYCDSEVFRGEKRIIEILLKQLQLVVPNFKIVYSPHPASPVDEIKAQDTFQNENIIVYNDTVFSILASDACVGFLSSVLFEAQYIGVPTFTPLIPSDNLFDEDLLSLISAPKDGELIEKSLETFIAKQVALFTEGDKRTRAINRFDKILNKTLR